MSRRQVTVRRGAMAGLLAAALLAACSGTTTSEGDGPDGTADGIPGLSDDALVVGIVYPPGTGGGGPVGGGVPADPAFEDAAEALAEQVNAAGGVQGRRLELELLPIDVNGSFTGAFQSACAALTQDAEVYAVSTFFAPEAVDVLAQCLDAEGTLLVFDQGNTGKDQAAWDEFGDHVFGPGFVYVDRLPQLVEAAVGGGFLAEPGGKVGVVYTDTPANASAIDGVREAVAAHGGEVVAETALALVSSGDAFNANAQQLGSSVLQFKSAGVDHVVFAGTSPAGLLVFMNSAEAQQLRPSYLLTSELNPTFLAASAPAAQLAGVVGVGWNPAIDTGQVGDGITPGGDECITVLEDAGIDTTTDPNRLLQVCDFFTFLETVVGQADSFEAADVRSAYASLEGAYESPVTFEVAPADGRGDGVAAVRRFAYEADCDCFAYASDPEPLP